MSALIEHEWRLMATILLNNSKLPCAGSHDKEESGIFWEFELL